MPCADAIVVGTYPDHTDTVWNPDRCPHLILTYRNGADLALPAAHIGMLYQAVRAAQWRMLLIDPRAHGRSRTGACASQATAMRGSQSASVDGSTCCFRCATPARKITSACTHVLPYTLTSVLLFVTSLGGRIPCTGALSHPLLRGSSPPVTAA
jgi:hypothetical protein